MLVTLASLIIIGLFILRFWPYIAVLVIMAVVTTLAVGLCAIPLLFLYTIV